MGSGFCEDIPSFLLDYYTPRIVTVKLRLVGAVCRVVQLCVIGYILIWVLIMQKGYQLSERGLGAVTTRVQGVAFPRRSFVTGNGMNSLRTWDTVDVVVPPEENKAVFVTTSAIVTDNQTQSTCAEAVSVVEARCLSDDACEPIGKSFPQGHGVSNGSCSKETQTCFVRAWCPLAPADSDHVDLEGTEDFTVLIKSHVLFPTYKTRASNIANLGSSYLRECRYSASTNPTCPVFQVKAIMELAANENDANFTFEDVVRNGAVVAITVSWHCNLDYNVTACYPTYRFNRLDDGEGYNYEYAHIYTANGIKSRQLIKAYGILFIISSDAQAGRFAMLPSALNIGSGLALLGLATVLCDLILWCCYSRIYSKQKYESVPGEESHTRDRDEYIKLEHPIGLNADI